MVEGEKRASEVRVFRDKEGLAYIPFDELNAAKQSDIVRKALTIGNWDSKQTARILRVPEVKLLAMMNRLGIKRPEASTAAGAVESPVELKGDKVERIKVGSRTFTAESLARLRAGAKRGGYAAGHSGRKRKPAGMATAPAKRKYRRAPVSKATLRRMGKAIRDRRLERGWKCSELAEQANMSPSGVSNLETGRYNPSMIVLERVAKALRCQISDFGNTRFLGRISGTHSTGPRAKRKLRPAAMPAKGLLATLQEQFDQMAGVSERLEAIERALDAVLGEDWRDA